MNKINEEAPIAWPNQSEYFKAWLAVCNTLEEVAPDWHCGEETGLEKACRKIREMSQQSSGALMALELIAADADAGNSRLTSGVRMALDAALIKAGRKEAPVRTGE